MDFRPLRWVTVILATMAGLLEAQVSMSPSGTASHPKIRWANATGNTVTFDITNLSSTNDYRYTRTCTGTGNVTITTCPTVGLIAFGTTRTVTATFSVGAAGTGSVQLSITESPLTPGGGSDSGTWTITTVTPTATVSPKRYHRASRSE